MTPPIPPAGGRGFGDVLGDGMRQMWNRVSNIPRDAQSNWMLWGLGALGAIFGLMSGEGLLGMLLLALVVPLAVQALGGFMEGATGSSIMPGGGRERGVPGRLGGFVPGQHYAPPLPQPIPGERAFIPGQRYVPDRLGSLTLPGQPALAQAGASEVSPAVLASLTERPQGLGLQVADATSGQPVRAGVSPSVTGAEAGAEPPLLRV